MTEPRTPHEIEGRRTVPAGLVLVTGLMSGNSWFRFCMLRDR